VLRDGEIVLRVDQRTFGHGLLGQALCACRARFDPVPFAERLPRVGHWRGY
jgi:hypothetical protein